MAVDTAYDILVEISDEDLPELAKMYKNRRDIPHVYSHILTGIEWKIKGWKNGIRFFSPNSCWKDNGTFVSITQATPYVQHIVIFSLDKSAEIVYETITNTNRIQYGASHFVIYYSLASEYRDLVIKAITGKRVVLEEITNYMMCMRRETAEKLDVRIPPGLYVKKLDRSFAKLINNVWPHKHDGSENFLGTIIELNNCFGLFLKASDEIVAWCLITILGQMGTLQTAEFHKRKGYGSLMTAFMAREIAKKGFDAFATVVKGNVASRNMFEKVGFKSLGPSYYINTSEGE